MDIFQYISIAGRLESLINEGAYPVGEKLPSLRAVHRQYGISIGTALKAFTLLADKGLIEGREKSGYVVLRRSVSQTGLPQSVKGVAGIQEVTATRTLQKAVYPELTDKARVSFFNAALDASLLPFNAVRRSLQQASRDLAGTHLQYAAANGHPLLRQEIAKRSFHWNGTLPADEIVVTNGALEAINLCLRAVTRPGDVIVAATPFYYGVLQSIEQSGLKVIELPCNSSTGINIPQLEKACKDFNAAACVLISNFNNPNGVILSDEKKRAIAAFASRQRIPVIDDDIYGDLHFSGRRPSNIKSYDTDGWVLLCSSFSKTVAPGYRVGWCAAGRFTEKVVQLKSVTNIATASIVQLSLLELLQTGAYDRHLRKLRPELHRLMLLTAQAIEAYFPAGTRISRPAGGMVLWVELPGKINAFALQKAALAQKIDIAPGPLFSNKGDYQNYVRLCYSNVWDKRVKSALKKLGELAYAALEGNVNS